MPQAPQSDVQPLCSEGGNALSAFRAQALLPQLQAVCERITGVVARHVHWVLPEPGQALDAQGRPRGIVAQLARALVVGPIARLELVPESSTQSADNAPSDALIEAQIPAQQFHAMGLREGETLVVTPRRAKVFLDQAAGI